MRSASISDQKIKERAVVRVSRSDGPTTRLKDRVLRASSA